MLKLKSENYPLDLTPLPLLTDLISAVLAGETPL